MFETFVNFILRETSGIKHLFTQPKLQQLGMTHPSLTHLSVSSEHWSFQLG